MAELEAIVEDYLHQAGRWQVVPAAGPCSLAESGEEVHDPPPLPRPRRPSRTHEQDLAIATLVGRYVERREPRQTPCAHDLFAVAAEFGDAAVDAFRTVLAFYEAMRATGRGSKKKKMRRELYQHNTNNRDREIFHAHVRNKPPPSIRSGSLR